jgi:protein O-mannosyl-transferase
VKSSVPGYRNKRKNGRAKPQAAGVFPSATHNYGRHALTILALSAITLLAFSNSFQAGFILDNKGLLLSDPRIRDATPENVALIFRHSYWWPTGEAGLYRPFTTLTYLFNYAVLGSGDQPLGYHWINFLLHLGNVWLAYALALRLIRTFWQSAFMAALWAVHPVLTESVTNIVGRADLLAAAAVLSGLLLYVKSAEATGWSRARWIAALTIVTIIGVFSKESSVAILPLIVLYELLWWRQRPRLRAVALGSLAVLLPIAAMLYQRSVVLAASPPAELPFTDNPIAGAGWWIGRITAIKVLTRYLWLTIWPAKLSCDYSYNQIPLARGGSADWLACGAILAAASGVAFVYRKNRACFFLACLAFLSFLPASNLLFPIGTIMADRLLYLPSLGLLGCLVLALYAVAGRPRTAAVPPVLLGLMVSGFAVRTWIRNRDWQTELAIATADARVSPNSFKLHRLLADSLFQADPSHSNIDQVIAEIERSVELVNSLPAAVSPPEVYRLAGYYYLVKSRQPGQTKNTALYQTAIQYLSRGISIDQIRRASYRAQHKFPPTAEGDPQAYLWQSMAYLELSNPEKALETANQALALDSLNPKIYRQLSAVYLAQGRRPEAEIAATLEDAITSMQLQKWSDAAELSDSVLHLDPVEYPAAYDLNAMANLRLGNLDLAEHTAREAMRLDRGRRNPEAGYILGLVLAQKQDFKQAAELLNAYLTAKPNAPDAETARRQLSEIERLAQASSTR